MSSLPDIYDVMRRIESCKSELNRIYMKAEFAFCARGIEVAGELTSTDKKRHTIPYGPKGNDVFLTEIDPPDIPAREMLRVILTALGDKEKAITLANDLNQKIKVAVFKVNIAKQHLSEGEPYPYRLVALPLDKQYDPWSQEIYDYYQDHKHDYVFPLNRQDNWEYITRKEKIFDGLYYPIKKYLYFANGVIGEELEVKHCLGHIRLFKCHAIRHVRADQLVKYLKFDGFDIGALVGWSMNSQIKSMAAPQQIGTYAEIREAWPRYIHKLCVPFNYNAYALRKPNKSSNEVTK